MTDTTSDAFVFFGATGDLASVEAHGGVDEATFARLSAQMQFERAIRDVVQNHLLQVIALLALNAPVGTDAGAVRAEKLRLLRAMRPLHPAEIVRGQCGGAGAAFGPSRAGT